VGARGQALLAAGAALAMLGAAAPARASPMSTSPEQAYDLGEIPSARAVGMAGALNALGMSTSALYLNPANMPLARVYHFEGLAAYMPEAQKQTYGLAVVDSMSSRLAGGLAGVWQKFDPSGVDRTWTDFRVALALPLGDHLSLGALVRWLRVEQAVDGGPFGASPASGGTSGSPIFNELTLDAGATVSIVEGLRVAAVGHNLTFTKSALAPTIAAAGAGYASQTFALELDGLLDFTTWSSTRGRIMAGGELFLADHYAIRAGWRYDWGTDLNTPSIGLGYIDTRWSVELGVRHDLTSQHASTLLVLSLRYFYDPNASSSSSPSDQLIGLGADSPVAGSPAAF